MCGEGAAQRRGQLLLYSKRSFLVQAAQTNPSAWLLCPWLHPAPRRHPASHSMWAALHQLLKKIKKKIKKKRKEWKRKDQCFPQISPVA